MRMPWASRSIKHVPRYLSREQQATGGGEGRGPTSSGIAIAHSPSASRVKRGDYFRLRRLVIACPKGEIVDQYLPLRGQLWRIGPADASPPSKNAISHYHHVRNTQRRVPTTCNYKKPVQTSRHAAPRRQGRVGIVSGRRFV